MNGKLKLLGALVAFGLMTGTAWAAEQYHHDTRYHMDHTYPARGNSVRALPSGHVPVYDRARSPITFTAACGIALTVAGSSWSALRLAFLFPCCLPTTRRCGSAASRTTTRMTPTTTGSP